MVSVSRSGARVDAREPALASAQAAFIEQHYLLLRSFLARDLVSPLQRRLAAAPFVERVHLGISPPQRDLRLADDTLHAELQFVLNDRRLFDVIARVTGCERIGSFQGSAYRMLPGARHAGSWHNDLIEHRLAAMSINLSEATFGGGELEIRRVDEARVVARVANRTPGDAVLFRVDADLEHRVTAVEGAAARTVVAGWFVAEPSYEGWMRDLVSGARA